MPCLGTALALFVAARRWPRTFFRALATASPAGRAEMLPVLDATSFVLAALIAVWFAVFHAIVLDANATSPPTTPVTPVLVWAATMAGVGVVMGLVVGTCITRAARRTG